MVYTPSSSTGEGGGEGETINTMNRTVSMRADAGMIIVILVALMVLITSGSLYWYMVGRARQSQIESLLIYGRSQARALAGNSEDAVVRQDTDALRKAVNQAAREQDIAYAMVSDVSGQLRIQAGLSQAPDIQSDLSGPAEQPVGESVYDVSTPIARKRLTFTASESDSPGASPDSLPSEAAGRPAGVARIGLSIARVNAALEQQRLAWILMTLILAALGAVVAYAAVRLSGSPAPKPEIPEGDKDWEHEAALRATELREAVAQQAATSAILRIIASSPSDLQPALDAVAEHAAKLCEANDAQIFLVTGNELQWIAGFGPLPVMAKSELLPITPNLV